MKLNFAVAILFALFFGLPNCLRAQKMDAEQVLAKHLESIGPAEKRGAVKNQIALGTAAFNVARQKNMGTSGNVVIASDANRNIFGMSFSAANYPSDKFGFNGKQTRIGFALPGARSPLGNFLFANPNVLESGLFGGTSTSAWSLANLANRKAKLDFDGTHEINGKKAYVLTYLPKGGADVSIKLYFDAQTFEHLRTEYRRQIAGRQGINPDASARQSETRQTLTEDFSDYKKAQGLNLPHSYRVNLATFGQNGNSEYEWKIAFSQYYFNQQLDDTSFNIEANQN